MEGEAQPEHAGLAPPGRDPPWTVGVAQRQPAHHGKPVRMAVGRGQRDVVAIALPGRRHDDDPVDTGSIHVGQQLGCAKRRGAMGQRLIARRPGSRGRIGRPEMNLRVDDQHATVLQTLEQDRIRLDQPDP